MTKKETENIDWKSIKLWKRKKIKEAKLKELNSWKQNDVYEEVDYRNQKLISTRLVLSQSTRNQEINRQVYLKPPKDFAREGKLWLLKKTVYGQLDASKSWYTRVKEELLRLNVKISKYDPGLFMYQYRGTLHGLLVTHADDFLWGGSHVFVENVIKPLHEIFEIGSVNKKAF